MEVGISEGDYNHRGWFGQEEFIFGFEGSQTVLARPSDRGKAFYRH
jgi:hypothetical protein